MSFQDVASDYVQQDDPDPPVDVGLLERQLNECWCFLEDLVGDTRPIPGGFKQVAAELLARHGVYRAHQLGAEPPPEPTPQPVAEPMPEKVAGYKPEEWRSGV